MIFQLFLNLIESLFSTKNNNEHSYNSDTKYTYLDEDDEEQYSVIKIVLSPVAKNKISKCREGDDVTIYAPNNVNNFAIVYHGDVEITQKIKDTRPRGLGYIEKIYARPFTAHYHKHKPYKASIISIDGQRLTIECKLYQQLEPGTKVKPQRKKPASGEIGNYEVERNKELNKKYTPRKNINLLIKLTQKDSVSVGEQIHLRNKTLEEYIAEGDKVKLEFVNDHNMLVAEAYNYSRIKNIIKAQLNEHNIEFKILELFIDVLHPGFFYLNPVENGALVSVTYNTQSLIK